jgi:1-acyl-sn-glycerol-3-phosphate acyltransferase
LEEYTVPLRNRINRFFLRPLLRLLILALGPVEVTGKENVPPSGPYIIAINHVSLYEAPLAVSFWPSIPETMGAAEIWTRAGQSTLARLYGGIQVHRGRYDRQAVALAWPRCIRAAR